MAVPPTYVVLDGASAILTLLVATGFLAIARWSRAARDFLVAGGFTLLAFGFLFVGISHFGGVEPDVADAVRIFCQVSGAILLFLAYGNFHLHGRAHLVMAMVSALGGTLALGSIFYWLVPPRASLHFLPEYFAASYALMSVAYLGCALMSGYGWHKRPTWGRAMVPLGFLCWAFSTYTWIFIELSREDRFLPVVYTWRFAAVLLMLWAMVRRPRVPSTRFPDAAA